MNLPAPVSATTAIILAVLFVKLAFAVIKKRQVHKVVLGTGQHPDLEAAIRAHGNFAEYVPLSLLLIVFAEINHSFASLALGVVANVVPLVAASMSAPRG